MSTFQWQHSGLKIWWIFNKPSKPRINQSCSFRRNRALSLRWILYPQILPNSVITVIVDRNRLLHFAKLNWFLKIFRCGSAHLTEIIKSRVWEQWHSHLEMFQCFFNITTYLGEIRQTYRICGYLLKLKYFEFILHF